jgi:hypothetical protein
MRAYARSHPPQLDPIKQQFEQALSEPVPEGLSAEERRNLDEARAAYERGEQLHRERERQRREYQTFQGYLTNRIPTAAGSWKSPWPIVFWAVEIVATGVAAGFCAVLGTSRKSVDPQ